MLTMAEQAVTGLASSSEVGMRLAWPGLREGCGPMPLQLCAPARQALLRLQGQWRLPTGLYAQTLLFDIGEHLHHGSSSEEFGLHRRPPSPTPAHRCHHVSVVELGQTPSLLASHTRQANPPGVTPHWVWTICPWIHLTPCSDFLVSSGPGRQGPTQRR